MAKKTKQSLMGTSFYGTEIQATPSELIQLFPESFKEHNNGIEKTKFEFELETNDEKVFSIKDWKEEHPLKMTEIIDWHIGGFDYETTEKAAIEVSELLTELRAHKN